MWKKAIVALVIVLSVLSINYNMDLNASTSVYHAGGNVTGRINKAPGNLNVQNLEFQKGDRILLGTKNPESNEPIALQLIEKSTYTSYNCPDYKTVCTQAEPITAWLSITTDALGHPATGIQISDYIHVTSYPNAQRYAPYTSSTLYTSINSLNASVHLKDNEILTYPNYADLIPFLANIKMSENSIHVECDWNAVSVMYNKKGLYIASNNFFNMKSSAKDYKFSEDYWTAGFFHDSNGRKYVNYYILGSAGNNLKYGSGLDTNSGLESGGRTYALRPFADVDLTKVVFATSDGSSTDIAVISSPFLAGGYTNLHSDAVGEPMKLRLEDASLSASLSDIMNIKNQSITKASKDSTVYLNANANAGSDSNGINTVSALIFSNTGEFKYYKPLEAAKGADKYDLDLSGIPVGSYKIGIVNEVYNENSTAPADSSAITNVLPLEIVNPVSITVTPKTGLEYNKNVNQNDIVATYTTNNGVSPITTTIISDASVSGHKNDYQLFSISGGNVAVNSPNGLNAGDYYFKLNAIDANGDPIGGIDSATVHIVVGKTNPAIAFDDTNTTKKSISEATAGFNERATVNPATGTKIRYHVVGGDTYLIDIDEDTGRITYKGGGAFGKVTIRATADDDPSTGNDNYDSIDTEKEIIIYQEVDGNVTPDSNSSNNTIPTFTASDANIKANGVIGTIHGTLGTPDTIGGTTTTYRYGLKPGVGDANFFSVDPSSGVIKTTANLGVKSYTITVTVSDNWSTKEIPITINVGVAAAEDLKFYENSSSNTVITTKSVKATDTGIVVYATVKGSTNNKPIKYKIKDGSTNVIEVNPDSGAVTIHGVGTVIIVAEKAGGTGQADASTELTFTVTAGSQNFIYTDATLSNELPKSGSNYAPYNEIYEPSKTFQLYTTGNPPGTTVSYQLKGGSPSDVISVNSNGLVTVLNANLSSQTGKVIVQATSHDPSGNYNDKTIELPINIEKCTRTISFAENPIYVVNGKGKVTPVIEVDGIVDTDGDVLIEVDAREDGTIAWTSDNKSIEYDYSDLTGKDIRIHATKPMNRNYKAAETDGILHIMGPDENILAITSPGKIIYGDHFTIRSSQYDADSVNVKYTFEIDDSTYITRPTVSGIKAEFDAIKFSGTNKTTITVTRTADGETTLSKKVQVTVLPKPIEITIDDKEKYKGEANPALTYQDFKTELVSWSGVQDVIQEKDVKLSTTANTNSDVGSYPIKGDSNTLNKTYPNYSFSFKEGTLTIKEENIEDNWYHLEIDDGNNTPYTGNWTNQNVNIISDHNEYINLSLDQSTWKPTKVTVSKEGETNQSFWMKKDSGAITKEKQETIKIDKTPPKVKGIKAKDTNNKLQDIINKLSGGIFFKPGTTFEITTDDSKDNLKVSGTKEIAYKIYKVEQQARSTDELIKEGKLTVTNEKAIITISETIGKYKVCIIPTDNAGNENTESCHEVELKKINVDVDNDGKPDFNDSDGDGCPDLNIKWRDPNDNNKWIIINGDRDYDGIPDLNIDSDGDGKPDLNVDTDNDGKPDLNLVILKKADWKPTKCVKQDIDNGILEEYCTGTSVKAIINIDIDGDDIPDINIDINGDMKADINVSKDGVQPIINIVEITNWIPDKDYSYQKFNYDTMKDIIPLINVDTDSDGRPDVNIDLDGDNAPDINIDVDHDGIPDIDIDSNGDGKPDVNVDTDGDGKADENIIEIKEWKPNKNVDGDLPYDTMDFSKSDDPKEPDKPKNPTNDVSDKDESSTSVKGMYNPVTSIGGAGTGDETKLMLYISMTVLGLGVISYLLYRYQENTFQ